MTNEELRDKLFNAIESVIGTRPFIILTTADDDNGAIVYNCERSKAIAALKIATFDMSNKNET